MGHLDDITKKAAGDTHDSADLPETEVQPETDTIEDIEHMEKGDVWADSPFGSLTTDAESGIGEEFDLPTLTKIEAPKEPEHPPEAIYADETYEEKEERLSKVEKARAVMHIDTGAIADIKVEVRPSTSFMPGMDEREYNEREWKEIEEKEAELQAMLENFSKLPEVLDFKPGVTLIIGENGTGKSTLAKALYYAMEVHRWTLKKGKEWAEDFVFEYGKKQTDSAVMLATSGLAPQIARHIDITTFDQGAEYMGDYVDMPSYAGMEYQREIQYATSDYRYDELGRGTSIEGTVSDKIRHSHRQTTDEYFNHVLHMDPRLSGGRAKGQERDRSLPRIKFLDEPETGMSPKRHRQLIQELEDYAQDRSILIAPTNSVILADSDLPRIDLEHPERGIFRPSEYPED